MCGFAGLLGKLDANIPDTLDAMGKAIRHRGPDDGGTWIDLNAGIAMVHQRLSIQDLSSQGAQPMRSVDERWVIAYNGELYNSDLLRARVESADPTLVWRGHSDTEVLLNAIALLGLQQALELSVGMFAFALWDRHRRELHLCRDRFGEKPLFFGWQQGRWLFASETRALRAMPDFDAGIDRDALQLYFRYNYLPGPYSIHQGIQKLLPGCGVTLQAGQPEAKPWCYWSAIERHRVARQQPFQDSFAAASREFEHRLTQSIRGQMLADVPVGAFLSGGIDSSLIVALMQQQANHSVRTFSIGFDDARFDESAYASAVADHLGTHHQSMHLSSDDALSLVTSLPAINDEPFADSSQLPTLAVAQLARREVTVSLSGDGGDELGGGYTRFAMAAQAIKLRRRLGPAGRGAALALSRLPIFDTALNGQLQLRYAALRQHPAILRGCRALHLLGVESDAAAYRDMVSYWRDPHQPGAVSGTAIDSFLDPALWAVDTSAQDAVQLMDLQRFLVDDILVKLDRASMSVSLETRIPLLDHRLVEWIWSLPLHFRANGSAPKALLRDTLSRHLPSALIERPKMGFGVPLDDWLRGPLRDWAESKLDHHHLQQQGLLDASRVQHAWQNYLRGEGLSASHLWSILVLQDWLEAQAEL